MLPLNFHKTFIPDRRMIGSLLHFAALGCEGSYQEIGQATFIPMGTSTGKVPAILDYSRGMGLVELDPIAPRRVKRPILTQLGKAVYTYDRNLGLAVTQWLAHLNLCRNDGGAIAWHNVFITGRPVVGVSFTKEQLEDYLVRLHGEGRDRTGPLLRAYTEDAALASARVISVDGMRVTRHRAPTKGSYAVAVAAMSIAIMETTFPSQRQVSMAHLAATMAWRDLVGAALWDDDDVAAFLESVEDMGLWSVDRQMRPWIIERRALASDLWQRVFDSAV